MITLFTCVVIPCLNEEKGLAATCQSLGFGHGSDTPTDAVLILVDNGSTDATRLVSQMVQAEAPSGTVFLIEEGERGYVPPRHRGNIFAAELANNRGIPKSETLLVQADADTNYNNGYLDALRQTAVVYGLGHVFNARMGWPVDFLAQHQDYVALCGQVDEQHASLLNDRPDDVIIDDKACAYRIADYEHWGGHQREFNIRGNEIFSETTRLYLRAKSHGASRHLCEDAMAHHSARRVLSEPVISFATAGFPRDTDFQRAWQHAYNGPQAITDFTEAARRPEIELAITARREHVWGLFGLLPAHIARALGQEYSESEILNRHLKSLPQRNSQTMQEHPGVFIQDVLDQIDRRLFDS